jgi:hypothetical protein
MSFYDGQQVIALDGRAGTYKGSFGEGVYAFVELPDSTELQLIPMADLSANTT